MRVSRITTYVNYNGQLSIRALQRLSVNKWRNRPAEIDAIDEDIGCKRSAHIISIQYWKILTLNNLGKGPSFSGFGHIPL